MNELQVVSTKKIALLFLTVFIAYLCTTPGVKTVTQDEFPALRKGAYIEYIITTIRGEYNETIKIRRKILSDPEFTNDSVSWTERDINWKLVNGSWKLISDTTSHYTSGREIEKGYLWGIYFNVKMLEEAVKNFLVYCNNITIIDYEYKNTTRKAIKAIRNDTEEYIIVDMEYGVFLERLLKGSIEIGKLIDTNLFTGETPTKETEAQQLPPLHLLILTTCFTAAIIIVYIKARKGNRK